MRRGEGEQNEKKRSEGETVRVEGRGVRQWEKRWRDRGRQSER